MTRAVFADAETDGLYGRFLSAAAMVTDENGAEPDRFCAAYVPVPVEARLFSRCVMKDPARTSSYRAGKTPV